ncbi:FxsA family protein [Candidatus Omnitrophota bacterium]
MGYLIGLFIGVPLIELIILMKMGAYIGIINTLILIVGTGIIGAYLAKLQGLIVIQKLQQEFNEGHMPADQLFDGVIILCSGIVLLTPGLITDICGFLGLIPVTRNLFKQWVKRKIQEKMDRGGTITFIQR